MKKEIMAKIKTLLVDFCIIAACIFSFIFLLYKLGIYPAEIPLSNIGTILLLAIITALLSLFFSLANPKSNFGCIALHLLRFCAITASVLGFSYLDHWGLFADTAALLLTILSIVFIYGLVWLLNHWSDQRIAADINKQLDQYKKQRRDQPAIENQSEKL